MDYKIKITPRAEREAIIKKRVKSSEKSEEFFAFRNEKISLKVVKLEISLLAYRMENFRTYSAQREHIVKNSLPSDYFVKGQEVQSIQQQQHEVLFALAKKGKAGSVTPVIDVLRDEGQRETLLISNTGVVINGNRRLAAMRELYAENGKANKQFSHVDCMVLPEDASADDIVDIEALLQARPETRLDYDWIGDAQLINKLISSGKPTNTPKLIADRLNRTEADIKNTVQALVEANLYLKDWAEAEGQYSLIRDDAEQLFKDLPKLLSGKESGLQEASRAIAWTLLDNREQVPGRLYNYNAAIGKLADDVIDRFSNDLGLSFDTETTDDEDDEDFDVDFEDTDSSIDYNAIVQVLKDEERKEEAVEALIDACVTAIESEKGQKSATAALKAVSQAHSKLASLDLSKAAPNTIPAIAKQLHAITKLVEKHIDTASKIVNSESEK